MKRSMLFTKWFLSYLIFALISVVFIFQIYLIFGKSIEKEMDKLNNSFLLQIKTLIDGEINSIDQMSSIIGFTPEIQSVVNIQNDLTTKDRYHLTQVLKKLKLYNSSNDTIKSINIYLFKPEILITNESVYMKKFMHLFTEEELKLENLNFPEIINNNFQREVIKLSQLDKSTIKTNRLIYLQSLPLEQKKWMSAVLIIEIDSEKLSKYINNAYQKDGFVCVIDAKNRIVFSKGNFKKLSSLDYNKLEDNKTNYINIDGQKYLLFCKRSDIKEWKYLTIIPESICWKEATKLKNNTILVMLGLTIISIVLAFIFSNRYYKPLNKIVLKVKNKEENVDNEYEFIENAIEKNLDIQKQMKYKLSIQKKVLKNNFLTQLLKGKIEDEREIQEQLRIYNIKFSKKKYVVFIFKINNPLELSQFIIKNIVQELFSSKGVFTMVEIDEFLVGIFNFDLNDGDEYYYEFFEDILCKAYNQINTNFNIDYTTAISNIHNSLIGITEGYREALYAIAYTKILGNIETIFYADTLKTNRKYNYSIEKEQQLINFIKLGNVEKAKIILNKIIDIHLKEKMLSLESFQCLMFDLLSSIIKTLNNDKEQQIFEQLKPIKTMVNCSNADEMKKVLNSVLEKICEIKEQEYANHDENSLSQKVLQFIRKNYSDPNMNVSMIGDYFNMTPAYVSKLYKKKTGESILNTINLIRIEEAKKLLKQNNYTVNEISIRVGFTYSNAFIRIFKKYEGVTPGQYKSVI